jgi:hypothetical protein
MHVFDYFDVRSLANQVRLALVFFVIIFDALFVNNCHAVEIVVRQIQVLSGFVFHFLWLEVDTLW